MESVDEFLGFKTPFNCLVAGPSFSGKTTWVRNVLENHQRLIDKFSDLKVLWCQGIECETSDKQVKCKTVKITYFKGVPTEEDLEPYNTIVLDDLLVECAKDANVTNLFARVSHHKGKNVFVLVQNLFYKSTVIRNLNLNSTYIILFRNIRDKTQAMMFARQFMPWNKDFFLREFKKATTKPFGYLVVDLHQTTNDAYRLRSNIFNVKEGNPIQTVHTEK